MSPSNGVLTGETGMYRRDIETLVNAQGHALRTELDKEARRRFGVIRKRLDKIDTDISDLKDGHEGIHSEIAQIRETQKELPVINEKLTLVLGRLDTLSEQTQPVVEATKRFRRWQDTGHDVMWVMKTKTGKWVTGIIGVWMTARLTAYFGGQPLESWLHNEIMRLVR